MTTQPQTDAHSAQINAETERAVHDFVRSAVSGLSEAMKGQAPEWEVDSQWECGTDGHFRERPKRTPRLWQIANDQWLHSLSAYQMCIERLRSDAVVGPHLDRLVGT